MRGHGAGAGARRARARSACRQGKTPLLIGSARKARPRTENPNTRNVPNAPGLAERQYSSETPGSTKSEDRPQENYPHQKLAAGTAYRPDNIVGRNRQTIAG